MERTTGFKPATLTLAKETQLVLEDRRSPLSRLSPVSSSVQSAESARLQRFTFNALNQCEIVPTSFGDWCARRSLANPCRATNVGRRRTLPAVTCERTPTKLLGPSVQAGDHGC